MHRITSGSILGVIRGDTRSLDYSANTCEIGGGFSWNRVPLQKAGVHCTGDHGGMIRSCVGHKVSIQCHSCCLAQTLNTKL